MHPNLIKLQKASKQFEEIKYIDSQIAMLEELGKRLLKSPVDVDISMENLPEDVNMRPIMEPLFFPPDMDFDPDSDELPRPITCGYTRFYPSKDLKDIVSIHMTLPNHTACAIIDYTIQRLKQRKEEIIEKAG